MRPHADCFCCLKWHGACEEVRKPLQTQGCPGCVTAVEPQGEEAETLPLFGEVGEP